MKQSEARAQIWIVGKNQFQNSLLQAFLNDKIAPACRIVVYPQWPHPTDGQTATRRLCLLDCYGIDPSQIWPTLTLRGTPDPWIEAVALFNVESGAGLDLERQAIEKKYRGVFYQNEAPDLLLKAIGKILMGELWYSRQTTSQLLMESRRHPFEAEAVAAMLTHREKEILVAIASGASNSEISEDLSVSPHTIKAHLYSIYKKIEVRNRLEATLWVARYL